MAVFGRVGNWRVRTRSPSQLREHPSFFLSLCIFVRRAHTDHSHPLPFLTCFVARRTCHTPLLQSRCTYSKTLFPFHSTARRLSWPHRTFETANVCPVTYYSWILQRKRSASRGNRGPFVRLNCDSLCPTPTRKLETIAIFSRKSRYIFFLLLYRSFIFYSVSQHFPL